MVTRCKKSGYNSHTEKERYPFYQRKLILFLNSYEVYKKIIQQYGSLQDFFENFINVGLSHFGSGWGWLLYETNDDVFKIVSTENAVTPCTDPVSLPILVCDLWEHAYYVDFRNNRKSYISEMLTLHLNWRYMENNYLSSQISSNNN